MIFNATLIEYTTPATPDARGGRTPGATTAYPAISRACVDRPTRAQLVSSSNKIAGVTGVIYMPLATLPAPSTGGVIKYRLDGMPADSVAEILDWTSFSGGSLSHFQIMVKSV